MNIFPTKIKKITDEFSIFERIIFYLLSFLLIYSAVMLTAGILDSFRTDAPARGGTLREGVVGSTNFINPILSNTNTGRDLSYLTYSGLTKLGADGKIEPDLAESYTVSDDGLTYTFTLRDNIFFQDGVKITSADVLFTINKLEDPTIKSPFLDNWSGVSVQTPDSKTIIFTLKTPYSAFLENTTIGIMPEHIWKDANLNQFTFSPYNFNPVGSGPYKVDEIKRDTDGAVEYYKLSTWNKYWSGQKNISYIYLYVYPDEDTLVSALENGKIDSAGELSPSDAVKLQNEGFKIVTAPLLRVFGVFLNQNQDTTFADLSVRKALSVAVDKKDIIDKVLLSFANEADSPLPGYSLPNINTSTDTASSTANAISILEKDGWKIGSDGIMEKGAGANIKKLAFTLNTSDNPELSQTAKNLKEQWQKIGVDVTVVTQTPDQLNKNVIHPRKYDALLFGEVVGHGDDLYPFWYSAERKDPGLNIAQYTNATADSALKSARSATTTSNIMSDVDNAVTEIDKDYPSIFLYSPEYIYVAPKDMKGLVLPPIEFGSDRWVGILNSYINTKRVW